MVVALWIRVLSFLLLASHVVAFRSYDPKAEETPSHEVSLKFGRYAKDYANIMRKGWPQAFCARSVDGCKTVDGFPGADVHNELTWHGVVGELLNVSRRLLEGKIVKSNDLGYGPLGTAFWESDVRKISLGLPLPDHQYLRPIYDRILGAKSAAWTSSLLSESIADLLRPNHDRIRRPRNTLSRKDLQRWIIKVLHLIHLNISLSYGESEDFRRMQAQASKLIFLPDVSHPISKFLRRKTIGTTVKQVQEARMKYILLYEDAIRQNRHDAFPESIRANENKLRIIASAVLDSICFAGGLSIAKWISNGLALLYGSVKPQVHVQAQLTRESVEPFVHEVLRLWPPVVGFPYRSPNLKHRIILNLLMALRDEAVWGKNASYFNQKPMHMYETFATVAWAEPGNGLRWADKVITENSRGCPAKDLSITIVQEFFHQWYSMERHWAMSKGSMRLNQLRARTGLGSFCLQVIGKQRWFDVVMVSRKWLKQTSNKTIYVALLKGDTVHPGLLRLVSRPELLNSIKAGTTVKLKKGAILKSSATESSCFELVVSESKSLTFCVPRGEVDSGDEVMQWITSVRCEIEAADPWLACAH